MPEFTAVFCQADDMMYSVLPRAEFIYTQQIGRGICAIIPSKSGRPHCALS